MLKKTSTLAIVTGLFLSSQASFANTEQLFSAQTKEDVQVALSDQTYVDTQDHNGESALYKAAVAGNEEVTWALLFNGANVRNCKRGFITPWMRAGATSTKRFFKLVGEAFKPNNKEGRRAAKRAYKASVGCQWILTKWPFMTEKQRAEKKAELGL